MKYGIWCEKNYLNADLMNLKVKFGDKEVSFNRYAILT